MAISLGILTQHLQVQTHMLQLGRCHQKWGEKNWKTTPSDSTSLKRRHLREMSKFQDGTRGLPSGKLTVCYWKWQFIYIYIIYSGCSHWKMVIFPSVSGFSHWKMVIFPSVRGFSHWKMVIFYRFLYVYQAGSTIKTIADLTGDGDTLNARGIWDFQEG